MARDKKTYNTPDGLRFAASGAFSNASMAWILYYIWSLLVGSILKAQGITGYVLTVVGYVIMFYAAIRTFTGLEAEIQADSIRNETPDRSLPVMKKLVIVSIVVSVICRILLILLSILRDNTILSLEEQVRPASEEAYQVAFAAAMLKFSRYNAMVNIPGAIFTTVNLLAVFSYKIFVADGKSPSIRRFSIASLVLCIVHLLTAEIKYLLTLLRPSSSFSVLSFIVSATAVVSYFTLYLMFEARKNKYGKSMKQQ